MALCALPGRLSFDSLLRLSSGALWSPHCVGGGALLEESFVKAWMASCACGGLERLGGGVYCGRPKCVRFLTLLLTIFALWLCGFFESQPDVCCHSDFEIILVVFLRRLDPARDKLRNRHDAIGRSKSIPAAAEAT